MDIGIVVARALHVVLGAFWVGAILFNAIFLAPAMADAGPDGAKVGAALAKRGFMKVMPIVAIITILAGFWLYWRMSGGFQPAYMRSGPGMAYGAGGALAVLGYVLGMSVMRPAMLRAADLAGRIPQTPEASRPQLMAEAGALRAKAMRANQGVAVLLALATLLMAVGRYVF